MISVFIEKRHSEVVSLHEVVQNFKIKKCQWLKGNNNLEILKCTEMLYELIWWIFECLVIPLLKLNFYITNHAKQGNRLSYYRREIWFKMVEQNLKSLTSSVYEKIPSKNEETIFKNRKLGYSELKFLPKDNKGNLRPIVNMKRPMRTSNNIKRPKSINSILNMTFQILKYEKEKNPSLLTGSIFNYNEVHACLKEYKKHLSNDDNPRLYFAKVDIKCCFETIDQNILMEIIEKEVLTEYQYSVNKFEAIYLKGGTIYRKCDNFVHDSSEFLSFPKYSAKLTQNYKNAILIDNVYESYMEVKDVLELLKEHIQQNIIKVNEEYYKQKVGIPQGSVLSSLLCSIYYGVMEQEEFKYIINNTNGLLLHFLDDFLYISTNKNNVIKFITTMHQDDLKYKIVVNDKKKFPWCGILIDTRNLDVKVDYSRYSDLSR
ncbi:telomerase reverse transcriptase [Rhizophagus irregularis DAOM 181602=DAOM 197198]|nr:telomerase reverse transcriptase [Rhizophagus irregularis DAOM 181602=DAOM 197198]